MATTAGYVSLDEFIPEVLQYCNAAPSIMVRIHLINATIDLCNKSLCLKKSPSALQLEEDVHTYTLKYQGNRYRALAVDSAKIENSDRPLIRTTEREMDGEFSNWRETDSNKPSRFFLTDDTNKIRVWPTPNADIDSDFQMQTVVTYKRGQTEVDEFIYEKWHEVIQAGCLAKMLMIPGASWFNARLAQVMARAFSRGVREARKTTLTGTGKYPGRVIPQDYIVSGSNAGNRSGTYI